MNRYYPFLFFLGMMLSYTVSAQHDIISVEIVVDQVSHGKLSKSLSLGTGSTKAVYKFYYDDTARSHLITNQCIVFSTKEATASRKCEDDPYLRTVRKLKAFPYSVIADSIVLMVENFEDDRGDSCMADKGDDFYDLTRLAIAVSSLRAGEFSKPITLISNSERFSVVFRIRYSIPDPEPLVQEASREITDVADSVTLSSRVRLTHKANLAYVWQYKVGEEGSWDTLREATSEERISFKPAIHAFKKTIKKTTDLRVRMKAVSADLHSAWSEEIVLSCTPGKPIVDTAMMEIIPTCSNLSTGTLILKGTKSAADSIAYFVCGGPWTDTSLGPEAVKETQKLSRGTIPVDSTITIRELSEGTYTLVLYNANMRCGKVYHAENFTVTKYAPLAISTIKLDDASCDSIHDGKMVIELEGGNPADLTFALSPATGYLKHDARYVEFSNLPSGYYTVFIKDQCRQTVSPDAIFVGSRPSPVPSAITLASVTDTAKGAVQIAIDLPGSEKKFRCILSKNHKVEVNKEFSTPSFALTGLEDGIYDLKVWVSGEACAVLDTSFKLLRENLPVLAATLPVTKDTVTAMASATTVVPALLMINGIRDTTAVEAFDPEHMFYGAPLRRCVVYRPIKKDGVKKGDYYIVVEKSKYQLHVYDATDQLLATYPVTFGNSNLGNKMMEGDRETPEGIYHIMHKRVHNKWQKFMALDYPNEDDKRRFEELKKQKRLPQEAKIGSSVGFHGTWEKQDITVDRRENWTEGCVSTKNDYIEELYAFIPKGTKVIIRK